MKKSHSFILLKVLLLVTSSFAADSSLPYVDPRGISPEMSYQNVYTDSWGQILGTIPLADPGINAAYTGSAYANGMLILCKNVPPYTSPSLFYKINPQTGAVLDSVNFPFNGYVMGCTFDGTNLWVVQWMPGSFVHEISLTGALINTFPMTSTYPYNCRAIMWDGQYLWLGANDVPGQSRLYRMNTSGVVQLSFVTNTAVGWYMDGEFDTNAPFGSNFCVVDNIGNTIKRLQISGSFANVVDQSSSPAGAAEGLAFDGNYLWHNDTNAGSGVMWKIDDGLPMTMNLDLTIMPVNPPIVIPANGGSFQYTINVHNLTTHAQTFSVWNVIKTPQGVYIPTFGPVTRTLPGSANPTRTMTQNVAATTPAGVNTYISYLGTYPNAIQDSSFFTFIMSAVADGNPWITDNQCYGDFLSEDTSEPVPTSNALSTAYPNPFNPTTTISYQLPAADHVSLTVYDTQGREIAVLVNGYRDAGTHQVTFDGSNLASGIYFYRLESGGNSVVQKLVLLK